MILGAPEILSGHSGAIYHVVTDGKCLYSASADKYVAAWEINTGQQTGFAVRCTSSPYSLCTYGTTLWVGLSSGDMHVVDLQQKKEIHFFKHHKEAVFALSYLPNQRWVLAGDAGGNLSVWDADQHKHLVTLPLGCGKIRRIHTNPAGSEIAVGGADGRIYVLDLPHLNGIRTYLGHDLGCNSVIFDDIGQLVSVGKDGHLKIWGEDSDRPLKSYPVHNQAIYEVIKINQQFWTASRDKSIKIWQSHPFEIEHKVEAKNGGHKHSVNGLLTTWKKVVSYSDDRTIRLWNKD